MLWVCLLNWFSKSKLAAEKAGDVLIHHTAALWHKNLQKSWKRHFFSFKSEDCVHSNIHLETPHSTGCVSAFAPAISLLQTSPLLRLTMDKSRTVKSNYEKKLHSCPRNHVCQRPRNEHGASLNEPDMRRENSFSPDIIYARMHY